MANNHEQFVAFNDTIKLTKSKKQGLETTRDKLRTDISKWFEENKPDEIHPNYEEQGSVIMDVAINPIPIKKEIDGEERILYSYDLDDGIYFKGTDNEKDRHSIDKYHKWLIKAVSNHTTIPVTDKNACVRVNFKDGHNIDLPIYYIQNDGTPELAHKEEGWTKSEPKAFADWFNKKANANEQLRRLVRYMKAWANYRNSISDTKMPNGMILTILVTNAFESINLQTDRDDITLRNVLDKIQITINEDYDGTFECYRPTIPTEQNLFEDYSSSKKENFLKELNRFLISANQANNHPNQKDACLKWRKHFGDRFSCANAKDINEGAEIYVAPALLGGGNAQSA